MERISRFSEGRSMNKSRISWTDFGWPVVTGCTKESAGCRNCYAERMHHRFKLGRFSDITIHPEKLNEPSRKGLGFERKNGRRARVFVCPTSDLFHPKVPFDFITQAFCAMMHAQHMDFQVLTKRAERMLEWARENGLIYRIPDNIWMGVTAEDQEQYDRRTPLLMEVPARRRWISIEPMIGPIKLGDYVLGICPDCGSSKQACTRCRSEGFFKCCPDCNHRTIDWIVVGGESGPGARHMESSWARSIRDECIASSIPFYFKQWGEWLPAGQIMPKEVEKLIAMRVPSKDGPDDTLFTVGVHRAGHHIDGSAYQQFPPTITQ